MRHGNSDQQAVAEQPAGVYDRAMIRTNVHLTEKQLQRLRSESERTGLSVAEIIRRAVDIWQERPRKPRENGA